MSDFIFKFWPREEVNQIKTGKIIEGLLASNILGAQAEHWGKPAYKAGESLGAYLTPQMKPGDPYLDSVYLSVSEKDYGVGEGEEDFEFFDRNNVVSLYGADGTIEGGERLCKRLEEITGDAYDSGWEIL